MLYPIFGILMAMGAVALPTAFAAMGTLTGAAYLLLFTYYDAMGRGMKLIVHVTELRKAKGQTQTDLAKLANVSRKTINTIENNVFVPSTILALTLAKVLDVSVHDLP